MRLNRGNNKVNKNNKPSTYSNLAYNSITALRTVWNIANFVDPSRVVYNIGTMAVVPLAKRTGSNTLTNIAIYGTEAVSAYANPIGYVARKTLGYGTEYVAKETKKYFKFKNDEVNALIDIAGQELTFQSSEYLENGIKNVVENTKAFLIQPSGNNSKNNNETANISKTVRNDKRERDEKKLSINNASKKLKSDNEPTNKKMDTKTKSSRNQFFKSGTAKNKLTKSNNFNNAPKSSKSTNNNNFFKSTKNDKLIDDTNNDVCLTKTDIMKMINNGKNTFEQSNPYNLDYHNFVANSIATEVFNEKYGDPKNWDWEKFSYLEGELFNAQHYKHYNSECDEHKIDDQIIAVTREFEQTGYVTVNYEQYCHR